MTSKTYKVFIETPLGVKPGETTLNIDENGTVSGSLTMMGHTNTFENGKVTKEGRMEFGGMMWTPFGKMAYTLEGTLINDKINSESHSKLGTFKIYSE